MNCFGNKLNLLETIHSMSLFSISPLLGNVSQSEFFVMLMIDKLQMSDESAFFGVSNIADELHVSSPAISRTITSLEKQGFAERYFDSADRRSTGVRLTELGSSVFFEECSRISNFIDMVLNKMGTEKVHNLLALSNELLYTMGEELKVTDSKYAG